MGLAPWRFWPGLALHEARNPHIQSRNSTGVQVRAQWRLPWTSAPADTLASNTWLFFSRNWRELTNRLASGRYRG